MSLFSFLFPPAPRSAAPTRGINRQPIATIHGTSKAGFRPAAGANVLGITNRFGGKGGNASGTGHSGGGHR